MGAAQVVERRDLPIRRLSIRNLPGVDLKNREGGSVLRPRLMEDDITAFGCYITNDDMMPVWKPGVLLFCTRMCDPGIGDAVVLFRKGKDAVIRIVSDVSEEGFETVHMQKQKDGSFCSVKDVAPFEDLEEIAVIIYASRI